MGLPDHNYLFDECNRLHAENVKIREAAIEVLRSEYERAKYCASVETFESLFPEYKKLRETVGVTVEQLREGKS